jgi:bis(5'-nucleosyl)-tetraphosphatase (symmetrical)
VATYAVGDIQGCAAEFDALLDLVGFEPARDRLWLVGDLVNRGPASLAVLRRVHALAASVTLVLGNHDLHLLACALAGIRPRRKDTLGEVLAAPDRDELLGWLRRQPLFHHDPDLGWAMVHAGLPPQWDVASAAALAREVEQTLQGPEHARFLATMYGDLPARWDPALAGPERLRCITNCLTRLRYLRPDGALELGEKGAPEVADDDLVPWFAVPGRASRGVPIVFGHWSTLRLTAAESAAAGVVALDTGAVWGGALSACRLEDGRRYAVESKVKVAFD